MPKKRSQRSEVSEPPVVTPKNLPLLKKRPLENHALLFDGVQFFCFVKLLTVQHDPFLQLGWKEFLQIWIVD